MSNKLQPFGGPPIQTITPSDDNLFFDTGQEVLGRAVSTALKSPESLSVEGPPVKDRKIKGGTGGGDKGGGFGNAMKSEGMQMGLQMLGSIASAVPSADRVYNTNDALAANIRGQASSMLMSSGNPWAMAAGATLMAIDKTGGFTDASKGLGGTNDTLNFMASLALPGAGWFTGKTKQMEMSEEVKKSSGYAGTQDAGKTAQQNAGAKILFGKNKANNMINEYLRQDAMIQNIIGQSTIDKAASQNDMYANRVSLQMSGGYDPTVSAKFGTKLQRAKRIVSQYKINHVKPNVQQETTIQEFKNGGSFNVIPEGALHKNKHHLEQIDDKYNDVTTKGIPVITESEGGEIVQHAEVERQEIIFRIEVTKTLEKLAKEGTDEAAIKAGKLLVEEILYNTKDNTNNML